MDHVPSLKTTCDLQSAFQSYIHSTLPFFFIHNFLTHLSHHARRQAEPSPKVPRQVVLLVCRSYSRVPLAHLSTLLLDFL
jgi:hypothetical protein